MNGNDLPTLIPQLWSVVILAGMTAATMGISAAVRKRQAGMKRPAIFVDRGSEPTARCASATRTSPENSAAI